MDEELAISLKNISKCYRRYAHPVDRLKELLLPGKPRAEEFWALHNVNLDIPKGHTIGLVGRNGSGKSTLLQIITGVLQATTGQVAVIGRISALLELGSGFNPEFTGRQNVFFNGQLLGLEKREIEAKFDQIAAFADIGDFIEQPVKTYSSGMFIRLAFAVATSVEPDILVVDEALAVGDEAFQRKCFARIRTVQERGGTVLFVSHSAASVIDLCDSAILIERGKLLLISTPKLVITKYQKLLYAPAEKLEEVYQEIEELNSLTGKPSDKIASTAAMSVTGKENSSQFIAQYDPNLKPQSTVSYISRGAIINDPKIMTLSGNPANILARNGEYAYQYSVKFSQPAYNVRFGMLIKTVSGFELGGAITHTADNAIDFVPPEATIQVEFKFHCNLLPGVYFLNAGVLGSIEGVETYLHRLADAVMFRVDLENSILATAIMDFGVESKVSLNQDVAYIR